jgi:signal transduction histidine kinase
MPLLNVPTRLGLYAILLGIVVLSLFGGLFAADRALADADSEAATLDAHRASLVAERALRERAEALASGDDRAATWIVPPPRGAAAPLDSAVVRLAGATAAGGWPRIAIAGDSAGVLVSAIRRDVAKSAVVVSYVSAAELLAAVGDPAAARPWMALRYGARVLGARGAGREASSDLVRSSRVTLPGDQLVVEVAHPRSGRVLRTSLWMLGVLGLVGMMAALARERRQATHLAARTAELERLYQEVARSNKMKSEFLANVSHELRTPLNAIVGFVEMLREGVYGELTPRQGLPVDRIAASATHLRHLVDRLLDIAKIAAGRLEVHPEPLMLRPFVLNVASEMESLVSERGLALSIAVPAALPRIRTDQTHLRQILINLIGNAVKYTSVGGIQVRATLTGKDVVAAPPAADGVETGTPPDVEKSWVALQVVDSGVGIAPADTERIFDEFEQVNAGARTDSARRGTGLGLAISRRLARLLGGELTVLSTLGKGSVFTVWLPLDADKKADQS